MQATEHYPGQTTSQFVSRHDTVQIQGDGEGPNNELPILSTEIPGGNGERALSLQVPHEQLKESATGNLQQIMAGAGPQKFKSFHKCVSFVCLVEERKKGDANMRERKLLLLVFSFEPACKRQQDYTCPNSLLTLRGVQAKPSLNCYIFELPMIFLKFFALFWYFTSLKLSSFFPRHGESEALKSFSSAS